MTVLTMTGIGVCEEFEGTNMLSVQGLQTITIFNYFVMYKMLRKIRAGCKQEPPQESLLPNSGVLPQVQGRGEGTNHFSNIYM